MNKMSTQSAALCLLVALTLCSVTVGFLSIGPAEKCCAGNVCYNNKAPYDKLLLPECVEDYKPRMNVYTRSNKMDGQLITRSSIPSVFVPTRQTIFIVHGWMSGDDPLLEGGMFHLMKNTFLEEGDYNVVIVGWKDGAASPLYLQSAANTRSLGMEIALVVKNLMKVYGDSIRSSITCNGASLGAHVCGFAGKVVKLGRCTGLDPAWPNFEFFGKSIGLNRDCADFVDIMHTSSGGLFTLHLGIKFPIGHVDFYPNGGGPQPWCTVSSETLLPDINLNPKPIAEWILELTKLLVLNPMNPSCSHTASVILFTETIKRKCFVTSQKCADENNLPGSCPKSSTVQSMGWDAIKYKQNTGMFYLETSKNEPYCKN